MLELGEDLPLLDDLRPPVGPNRLLGKFEHSHLLELRMDDTVNFGLAARRKTADHQISADRGR